MKLTIVIPALNEEKGIGPVLKAIPMDDLSNMGYDVEVLVIDNGSTDRTRYIARQYGATVIVQPIRGYGNAYKAGFANASGDIIATGDADLTYPFDALPDILGQMQAEDLDFITTDRLATLRPGVMSGSHQFGNQVLTAITRVLFGSPFRDSQSGMWIFHSRIWSQLDVRSSGMPFSQELKLEAYAKGFRCAEVPIDYRARAGKVKLRVSDGPGNILHLLKKRLTLRRHPNPLWVSADHEEMEQKAELG